MGLFTWGSLPKDQTHSQLITEAIDEAIIARTVNKYLFLPSFVCSVSNNCATTSIDGLKNGTAFTQVFQTLPPPQLPIW